MEETVLTWNVANWITVLIMVALGFAVLSLIGAFLKRNKGGDGKDGA